MRSMSAHGRTSRTGRRAERGLMELGPAAKIGIYVFMIVVVIFDLLPFVWLLVSAFGKKPENTSGLYLYIPTQLTLDNFGRALDPKVGNVLHAALNSLGTVGGAILLAVTVCTLGGYSLSRARFKGRRSLLYAVLLLQVIPPTATILPLYLVMRDLHLLNTLQGVALGLATFQVPFVLWVIKGFFDGVPFELEESAWLDGASRLTALFRIVLPMALPGVGAAAVLAFNSAWGHFFLPLVMISDQDKYLMPQALFTSIINYTNVDYGLMNSVAMIYALPSLLFFFFARKYLIRGMTAGALAGQ